MRSSVAIGACLAVTIAIAGTIMFAVDVRPDSAAPGAAMPPRLSFEQNRDNVVLRIRNVNSEWGLRRQRVQIVLTYPGGYRLYGPDGIETVEGRPELGTMRCCLIPELRPGAEFEFRLFPSRFQVLAVDVTLAGGPGWVSMS